MMKICICLVGLLCLAICVRGWSPRSEDTSVPMKIINFAKFAIKLHWVASATKMHELTPPIQRNEAIELSSFNQHQFVISTADSSDSSNQTQVKFAKGPVAEEFRVYFDDEKGLYVEAVRTSFDFERELDESEDAGLFASSEEVEELVEPSPTFIVPEGQLFDPMTECKMSDFEVIDDFYVCLAEKFASEIASESEKNSQRHRLHAKAANRLRNYTCADSTLQTSPTLDSYQYVGGPNGSTLDVNVIFKEKAATIMYAHDFITPEECEVLMSYGAPRLRRATVAAEDGTSIISENRKAQQASYTIDRRNGSTDPLGNLYERILNFTNSYTGYNLTPEGQEDFTIIQYGVYDQYSPHCDGQCDGLTYNVGGRIATTVLYCKAAEEGGQLSFSRADVFVKPKPGTAAFFSYLSPDGKMDEGYTEHSSCPVIKGEKWATAVWMRKGVSEEHPWTILDPEGKLILEAESEQEQ